jgi:hypothetical protein
VQAIAQSPRSLWDPSYSESSWIHDVLGGPIRLLPRLQAKIAASDPGMALGITEYNNGGCKHIAGTLAQADNLGIFGAQGVRAATYWPLASNVQAVAAYASTDSAHAGRAVFVAINRSASTQRVAFSGLPVSGTAQLWRISASSAAGQNPVKPVSAGAQAVSGTSFSVSLPALSVTTIAVD